MRRNIHFYKNSEINQKGVCGYNPLLKVIYMFRINMKGIRGVWTAIKYVNIDESMIKYMVRAITYVQYMPSKPIKNCIKVFAICYDLSTILLGFKVYVGQENDVDNTALGIFDYLAKEAGLASAIGRTLYTNNYYTLMALAKHMFNKYG